MFPSVDVPAPSKSMVTRWRADHHSRGAYSYVAAGARGADYAVCAESVGERLFFAGEHTSQKHPATVVGAHLSGLRAAVDVNRMLRKKVDAADIAAAAEAAKAARKASRARHGGNTNAGVSASNTMEGRSISKRRRQRSSGSPPSLGAVTATGA
mmetsp:Transcript_9199/g.26939  ORF Transcript_9199/g.26939 Transcript_9199/m.26939 type:complete len:154 (+) Transcript_9199:1191-1652(+)